MRLKLAFQNGYFRPVLRLEGAAVCLRRIPARLCSSLCEGQDEVEKGYC